MSGPSEVRSVAADNPFVTGEPSKSVGEGYSGSVGACSDFSDTPQRHGGRSQEPAVGGWQLASAGLVRRQRVVQLLGAGWVVRGADRG